MTPHPLNVIVFFSKCRLAALNRFYETKLGERDGDISETANKYDNTLAGIAAQLQNRVKRDGEDEMHRVREKSENNELLNMCDRRREGAWWSGWGRGEVGCRQTAFINSICLCKRV